MTNPKELIYCVSYSKFLTLFNYLGSVSLSRGDFYSIPRFVIYCQALFLKYFFQRLALHLVFLKPTFTMIHFLNCFVNTFLYLLRWAFFKLLVFTFTILTSFLHKVNTILGYLLQIYYYQGLLLLFSLYDYIVSRKLSISAFCLRTFSSFGFRL